jgi:DNA polymerase epsilon subunit 1
MEWQWKGEYFPLNRKEYEHVKMQLQYEEEKEPTFENNGLNVDTQKLKQRVKKYC